MITLAYWQFGLLLALAPIGVIVGMGIMAAVAMAGYSDDMMEAREEE